MQTTQSTIPLIAGLLVGVVLLLIAGWYLQEYFVEDSASAKNESSESTSSASELRLLKEDMKRSIKALGPEKAYAEFLKNANANAAEGHNQAHAFGEALYESEGLSGLAYCDASFEFGCYHSFFGVAVNAEGIETLPKFDEACKDRFGSMNLPCQHGIGHGVLVYADYPNLVQALELCETVSKLPTGGCSSGVFMEYNFHTMDESREYLRELGDDPYEPCNAIPERFQMSCYFEQVQWWQNVYQNDFKKIGELCSVLPEGSGNYVACYNGIGNYVAAFARFDIEKIEMLCSDMPDESSKTHCHEGASWLVWAQEGGEDQAKALCEVLPESYRSQCSRKLQF